MNILSYSDLIRQEGGTHVQKGMNFGIKNTYSIVLMSTHKNAPYQDKMLEDGVIEYEGHDVNKSAEYDKKSVDQPEYTATGSLTENGKFYKAAAGYKLQGLEPAKVKVYRKIRNGIWVNMGFYDLVDAAIKSDGRRQVFKFILKPNLEDINKQSDFEDLVHNRQIPGDIQREVYTRDKGKCKLCGSAENLHFDHILPFSKGGSSKTAENIQLLCAKHNLRKGAKFI